MREIDSEKSYAKTLFRRTEKEGRFMCINSAKNPYEFVADCIAYTGKSSMADKLKKYYKWEDLE